MKLFHPAVAAAGVLLLLLALPPQPPRPPRGEESLSRHGRDFRAADQSSGWMSAAAAGGLQPHTNETNTDRPPTIRPGVNDKTLSRKCKQSSSSCPFPCTCLLLCSLVRTDSKIPEKSRPTLRSGTP